MSWGIRIFVTKHEGEGNGNKGRTDWSGNCTH